MGGTLPQAQQSGSGGGPREIDSITVCDRGTRATAAAGKNLDSWLGRM
jgi:hypothetical protein